ncbi:MAG: hypothetical protein EBX50_16350 [Chitinophagia bacterium]|nr:hypothetical protein [Chitinophagia bacterium]
MKKNINRCALLFIAVLGHWACDPNALYWDLPQKAQDASRTIACDNFTQCSSEYIYWSGTSYLTRAWTISSQGYKGNCFWADDPTVSGGDALGGTVQLTHDFKQKGFLRFWIRNDENMLPVVHGNTTWYSTNIVAEGLGINSQLWKQCEVGPFEAGEYTIKIEWPRISRYLYYRIDEIEFYEEGK